MRWTIANVWSESQWMSIKGFITAYNEYNTHIPKDSVLHDIYDILELSKNKKLKKLINAILNEYYRLSFEHLEVEIKIKDDTVFPPELKDKLIHIKETLQQKIKNEIVDTKNMYISKLDDIEKEL